MARKSRKIDFVNVGAEALASQTETVPKTKVSRAALYARLSFESDKNRERNTVETQMALLHNFVEGQKDIVVEKEFFDISKTGINFEREGFEEMMQAIRDGEVDCVIVKDLSRLGRNYVEAGSYLERVFPFFGVRFISVNDNYDSARDDVSLLVGMSNIYNEFYSRDLAKKIKAAYRTCWENGENPSGNVVYGYEKERGNPHHLVPDPNTAPIVQRIFRMFLDGSNYAEIVRTLNQEEILSPSAYKRRKSGGELDETIGREWRSCTIRCMLVNQYYVGDSVHNKTPSDTWAAKRKKANPKEKWIIIENTHEPLVSREDFRVVQDKIRERKKRHDNPRNKGKYSVADLNFFKKKIVCADCGKTIYLYCRWDEKRQFECGSHMLYRNCPSRAIIDTVVNDNVLRVIHSHINVYTENVDMIRRLNRRQESIRKYDVFSREIKKCRKELEELSKHRERLFEDYVSKMIDAEQYETFARQDAAREAEIRNNLDILLKHKVGYEKNFHTEEEWEKKINKYRNSRTLTKDMVDAFVEKIEISADKSITVHLVYDDMLEELRRYAKQREEETCV